MSHFDDRIIYMTHLKLMPRYDLKCNYTANGYYILRILYHPIFFRAKCIGIKRAEYVCQYTETSHHTNPISSVFLFRNRTY